MAKLSKKELNERIAILKHFKSLLEQQRDKFREYLAVLEKQQDSINSENAEAILAHTELGQQVIKNISNLQKVIVPMAKMYNIVTKKSGETDDAEKDIERLQNDLNNLQTKVLEQNEINRKLLKSHITELRTKIKDFQNPYDNLPKNVYGQKVTVGNLLEITA